MMTSISCRSSGIIVALIWVLTLATRPSVGNPRARATLRARIRDAAQAVVQGFQAVDRTPSPCRPAAAAALIMSARQFVAAGLHGAIDAVVADGAHDRQPVLADKGLAADDGNLARAKLGELPHHVDAFGGREFSARGGDPRASRNEGI